MNRQIRITAAAVKNQINLMQFAEGIGIKEFEGWKTRLELDHAMISNLITYPVKEGRILLYKLGVIVLIGLDESLERHVFYKLESFIQINYIKPLDFFKEYAWCYPEESFLKADAMAKSIKLKWIEAQVDRLIEQSEPLLSKINKGSKRGFTSKLRRLIAKIHQLEIDSTDLLAVLGRPYNGASKELYEKYIEEYVIGERLMVVSEKLALLKSITDMHELFGRFIGWQRLLMIEVALLFCFPLPSLLSVNIIGIFNRIYASLQMIFYSIQ